MFNKLNYIFLYKFGNGFVFLFDWCLFFFVYKVLVLSFFERGSWVNIDFREFVKGIC